MYYRSIINVRDNIEQYVLLKITKRHNSTDVERKNGNVFKMLK